MIELLWIGSTAGAVVGLAHGLYLYGRWVERAANDGAVRCRLAGLYYGAWALLLWTVFGAYVLAFWVIGAAAYLLSLLIPRRSPPAAERGPVR